MGERYHREKAMKLIEKLPPISDETRERVRENKELKEMVKEFLEEFLETDEGKEFINLLRLHLNDRSVAK